MWNHVDPKKMLWVFDTVLHCLQLYTCCNIFLRFSEQNPLENSILHPLSSQCIIRMLKPWNNSKNIPFYDIVGGEHRFSQKSSRKSTKLRCCSNGPLQWSPRHCYIMTIDGNLSVSGWNLGPLAGPVVILYLLLLILIIYTVFSVLREVLKSPKRRPT